MAVGKVLRFDHVRGYGFIEPDAGGEDLFLHVNDFLDDKHQIKPGMIVEFEVAAGDRGLKACRVQIRSHAASSPNEIVAGSHRTIIQPVSSRATGATDDALCDVLSVDDFAREITDLLLRIEPVLNGRQILVIREQFARVATLYGWVEN